ncbi:uncharacterized protein BDV17DRAFT_93113 [Aspergillus undulatus]|uniref:uncharacterized protein n=1 Tax=Aspergillus undulatus TaxID=1810928 RepID=UPI003CCDCA5A
MEPLAKRYLAALTQHLDRAPEANPHAVLFSSPVTGGLYDVSKVSDDPAHWVRNMTQPSPMNVQMLIEIGPHGALKGPTQQINNSLKRQNTVCLVFDSGLNACQNIQSLAGWLYCHGYPVKLAEVNFPEGSQNQNQRQKAVQGLSNYPWNHSVRYWHQPMLGSDTVHTKIPAMSSSGPECQDHHQRTPSGVTSSRCLKFRSYKSS